MRYLAYSFLLAALSCTARPTSWQDDRFCYTSDTAGYEQYDGDFAQVMCAAKWTCRDVDTDGWTFEAFMDSCTSPPPIDLSPRQCFDGCRASAYLRKVKANRDACEGATLHISLEERPVQQCE